MKKMGMVLAILAVFGLFVSPAVMAEEPKGKNGVGWEEVMSEFNKIWLDVEKEMANDIKGLSQNEIDERLTPIVAERTAERLKITEEDVFNAIDKFVEQEERQKAEE